ncbi:uncharacterized protein EV420DRAFT_1551521 [Desarmillaria tabescens]|uniref:F-box domain-containing protein n=1 Tax=Armillaria tabescens TaxID=1929756 RepID=A0AA39K9M0_ARMTA|nr:uncharacterized protein EV420DRAFT_1551521 [Desarmillaria tabescens]KAK0457117.1 hypothetical protein EV420DRAFT_1551521 [Desarmillaria tabescens]
MASSLLDIPPELIRKIIFLADAPLGIPSIFQPLLLTCRYTYSILSAPETYSQLFVTHFDVPPPSVVDETTFRQHAKCEMVRRYITLRTLHQGQVDSENVLDVLWCALSMFGYSAVGQKNIKLLLQAGVSEFLISFIVSRLYDASGDNDGWPIENEANCLAVLLLWVSTSRFMIDGENPATRRTLMNCLRPLVFAPYRYSISTVPEQLFLPEKWASAPAPRSIRSHWSCGAYGPPGLRLLEARYFGDKFQKIQLPPITLLATLAYFARQNFDRLVIPDQLPRTRLEANSLGLSGPTREDLEYFADHRTYCCGLESLRFCVAVRGIAPPYLPGTLTGRYNGSCLIPDRSQYDRWKSSASPPSPLELEAVSRRPFYVTLQEHVCYNIDQVIPKDASENGNMNAWLPSGFKWTETVCFSQNGIMAFDTSETFKTFYQTYDASCAPQRKIVDVIVTGKTEPRHAAAWGDFNFIGRIRLADGLITLKRISVSNLGDTILRGKLTSTHNFVGRMKPVSTGFEPSIWEAPFSLSKIHSRPLL